MIRAAAYCRVSTEKEDQLQSLENQRSYFERYIGQHPDWTFAGIYADEGASGTSAARRKGFMRMLQDASRGRFDLLLTKEISRFARNTLDSIYYTRNLREMGVGVLFLNDGIYTLDPDAELRLTIMAGIAQEESRKTSERVRWGQKRQMEKGVVFGNGVYGYRLSQGALEIDPVTAPIVRMIFRLCEKGFGAGGICRELEARGIPSPSGKDVWSPSTVLKLLRNEKYVGALKQKKEITIDYLSHRKIVNDGREAFVEIPEHHAPVVDRALFDAVQRALEARGRAAGRRRYSGSYVWSGKVVCAMCGGFLIRRVWNARSPHPKVVWQCARAAKHGSRSANGCASRPVAQQALEQAFMASLAQALTESDRKAALALALAAVCKATGSGEANSRDQLENEIARTKQAGVRLSDLYLQDLLTKEQLAERAERLQARQEQLAARLKAFGAWEGATGGGDRRMEEIRLALEPVLELRRFEEAFCRRLVRRVCAEADGTLRFDWNV